jgi:hypothetical protein
MMALAHCLSIASNILAAISSFLAAVFWYRASQVEPPKALVGKTYTGASVVDTTPLVKWAHDSGRRNKIAAIWSAWAAAFVFLAWALGAVKLPT